MFESASNDVGVAIFTKKLHVDKLAYQVTLLTGKTTLWYINTVWVGSWNPDAGYGGHHDNTGRCFIINGTEYNSDAVTPITVGILQTNTIEHSNSKLKWDQGDNVIAKAVGPLPVTDRILALGAWQSSAAFYNIVFECAWN